MTLYIFKLISTLKPSTGKLRNLDLQHFPKSFIYSPGILDILKGKDGKKYIKLKI